MEMREPNCKADCSKFHECGQLKAHLQGIATTSMITMLLGGSFEGYIEWLRETIEKIEPGLEGADCPVQRTEVLKNQLRNYVDEGVAQATARSESGAELTEKEKSVVERLLRNLGG